jgi:butyryl-CoA dehydrogenase
VVVTYANLEPDARHKGICAFVVETPCDGYAVGKVEEKMGIRCSSTSELVFSRMFVPEANRLQGEREGFRVAMATLDGGRIGIAAQALGIARAAFEAAAEYALDRKTFGKRIIDHQAIAFMLADMQVGIDAARLLTYRAAALKARGQRHSVESSMAKLFASETANRVAKDAIQVFGGNGYVTEYPVERHFRDAKITEIYEGTSEIQRVVIAAGLLRRK